MQSDNAVKLKVKHNKKIGNKSLPDFSQGDAVDFTKKTPIGAPRAHIISDDIKSQDIKSIPKSFN
jgi:hypothetical protein